MQTQPPMSELHVRILGAIPEGRDNAEPLKYIADKLAIRKEDTRKVYSIVNELIHRYGYCIGGSSDENTKGVFMIKDEDDLKIACKTLNTRAVSLLERSRKVVENFNLQEQEELQLEDEDDDENEDE
jgi:hypothetical protein